MIIESDFYLPTIHWNQPESDQRIFTVDSLFLDLLNVLELQQWVNEYTYLGSANILRLVRT